MNQANKTVVILNKNKPMKKIIVTAFLIYASFTCGAQTSLEITIDEGICLSELRINYDNESDEVLYLGCEGVYYFGEGEISYQYVTVNDVQCPMDSDTRVRVNDGKYADAQVRRGKITFKAKEGATAQ
jgi:hypothetical protein